MVVFANRMPGIPIGEAASGYFTDAMASNQEEELTLSMDGFIFVADFTSEEFCLSAFGAAENQLTDERIDAILDDVGPYTEANGPAAAVLDILETLLSDFL